MFCGGGRSARHFTVYEDQEGSIPFHRAKVCEPIVQRPGWLILSQQTRVRLSLGLPCRGARVVECPVFQTGESGIVTRPRHQQFGLEALPAKHSALNRERGVRFSTGPPSCSRVAKLAKRLTVNQVMCRFESCPVSHPRREAGASSRLISGHSRWES